MKKIKGLLLFGMLTLLGIGSSFATVNTFTAVEYFDNSNRFSNYIFSFNSSFKFMSANGGMFSSINSFFRTGNMTIDNNFFSSSNYNLLTGYYYGGNSTYANLHSYSNGLGVSLLYRATRAYGTYLLTLSNGVSSTSSEISNNTGMFFRIQDNDGYGVSSDNPFNTSVPIESARTFSFFNNYLYDSNNGIVYDLNFSGVDYIRGSVVGNVYDNYSFSYTPDYIITGSSIVIDKNSVPYFFSTVQPAVSEGWQRVNNLFIIKLDSFYKKTNTGDFRILAISLTGSTINEDIKDFIYSRYTCPYNSVSYIDCTYIDGGYLRSSNLSNAFSSYNGVLYSLTGSYSKYNYFSNLLFFLTISNSSSSSNGRVYVSPTIYSVESTNIITLYRPTSVNSGLNYSFGLSPVEGINVLAPIQGSGSFVEAHNNSVSWYYDCIGPLYNTSDGLPPEYCFNSLGELDYDRFQSCFTVKEITSDGIVYHNYCYIDGFQQEVELVADGSGYAIVPIPNSSSLDYLENGFSTGYFEDYLNKTGYFFKCPFPYTQNIVVRPKLISAMNGYDINLPINCTFAAFNQGRQLLIFENSGHFISNGPLLNFEGNNGTLLYTFFDILIILGLLFFFGKILKFFS